MSLFSFPGPFARGAYALIYKWSGSTFEEFYRLPTGERAYGVKALSVDGNHFLAVARWQAQTSLIFRWNQTHFDLFQEVPSRRVRYNVTHIEFRQVILMHYWFISHIKWNITFRIPPFSWDDHLSTQWKKCLPSLYLSLTSRNTWALGKNCRRNEGARQDSYRLERKQKILSKVNEEEVGREMIK